MIRTLTLLAATWLVGGWASAQLDLPDADRRPRKRRPRPELTLPKSAAPSKGGAAEAALPGAAPAPAVAPAEMEPALRAFASVRGIRRTSGDAVRVAVDDLLALGEPGLAAARSSLASEDPAELVVAVRVLLSAGGEERGRVRERLRGRMPARSAGPVIEALLSLDPVGAAPTFFVELLGHSQGAVRTAARAALDRHLSPELLPALERQLAARQSETRLRALEVVVSIDDPAAVDLAFDALGDEGARVAAHAARFLARSDADGVEARLLDEVMREPMLLREGSYALLALIDREDERGTAVLSEEHVPHLLANLTAGNELSTVAAACALAGIGFRIPADSVTASTSWLDLIVPHHLVRAVSASTYHRDFGSVQVAAQRRLAILVGFSLGSDGPAWQNWWSDAAPTFRARRAAIRVGPGDVDRLWLRYEDGDERFSLAGESAPASGPALFYLTSTECRDLLRALSREDVFGVERLPNAAPAAARRTAAMRELSVGVGEDEKRFVQVADEAWFERVVAFARSLRDNNAWQRWVDPRRHPARRELWLEQRDFWSETLDPVLRGRRAVDLALDALAGGGSPEALDELERRFVLEGVPDAGDVRPLVGILRTRELLPDQVGRVVGLALLAARADAARPAELALDGGAAIDRELARDLAAALTSRFGVDAAHEIARVYSAQVADLARSASDDLEAGQRAGAVLALGADPSSRELLVRMLEDPEDAVEAAAVTALAEQLARGPESASISDTLASRTTSASVVVRVAALDALATLSDPRAVGALLGGVSDSELVVRVTAANALARLADPSTAPILVSMLARGPGSELFEPAREGLSNLGVAAHGELIRAVRRRSAREGSDGLAREAALLLAEDGVPLAVSPLLTILTEDPTDARVGWELAVLTCVDFRNHADPPGAWWEWWDLVVHDDSLVWLVAAGARAGLEVPNGASFTGHGDREAAAFLFDLAVAGAPHVSLRARRELGRRLGHELELVSGTDGLASQRGEVIAEWPE